MDVSFLYVLSFCVVLVGGEPGEAIIEHVNPQRVVTRHQNVHPQIVLEVVDQVRGRNVLGNQSVLLVPQHRLLVYHLYPPPTCRIRWLQNPKLVLVRVFPCYFKAVKIPREQVGSGDKVVGFWMGSSLLCEVLPHVVLPA